MAHVDQVRHLARARVRVRVRDGVAHVDPVRHVVQLRSELDEGAEHGHLGLG